MPYTRVRICGSDCDHRRAKRGRVWDDRGVQEWVDQRPVQIPEDGHHHDCGIAAGYWGAVVECTHSDL